MISKVDRVYCTAAYLESCESMPGNIANCRNSSMIRMWLLWRVELGKDDAEKVAAEMRSLASSVVYVFCYFEKNKHDTQYIPSAEL